MDLENITKATKILIFGYGKEGQSSYRFFSKKFPDKNIIIFDENPFHKDKKVKPPCPCLAKEKRDCIFDVVVVSPGIPREKLINIPPDTLTSNSEIFFENLPEKFRKKVIGISGTKGKSTTTKFCVEVLQEAGLKAKACGNYGVPLLDVMDDFLAKKYEYLVAELSSFQLENLQISPGIAVLLNILSDHLDRHKTQEKYLLAKQNLWIHQKKGDIFITPNSAPMCKQSECRTLCNNSTPFPVDYFPEGSIFRATYFLENFGTIQKLTELLNISPVVLRKIAKKFKGLAHRLEFFTEKHGIKFYDDALSTNPDATMAAVDYFGYTLGSIILGGQDRNTSFDELIKTIKQASDAQIIILCSEIKVKLLNSCKKIDYKKFRVAKNLKEAVKIIFETTPQGKVCLLSTAAPSFDLFRNYEEKGDLFKEYVYKY